MTKVSATGLPIRTGVATNWLDPNNSVIYFFNHGANALYSITPAFKLGNSSYYSSHLRQPWVRYEAVSFNKQLRVWESALFDYSINIFNPFNRTDFGNITSTINSPNFGRPTGVMVPARSITMGLRLEF